MEKMCLNSYCNHLIYLYAFSTIASYYQLVSLFSLSIFLFCANSNPVYFSRSIVIHILRWMPDPHFNAKQQQFKQKNTSSKSLCQNLVVGAFFEAEKNRSQMFLLKWKVRNHWLSFKAIQSIIHFIPEWSRRFFTFFKVFLKGPPT